MNPENDALYQVHQLQASRRRLTPLPYAQFCERVTGQSETDLAQLLPQPATVAKTAPTKPFSLGHLYVTFLAACKLSTKELLRAITRHASGDWGELDHAAWLANDQAVENGGRICSRYESPKVGNFWVITQADRSLTTVLLPEDY